MKEIGLYKMHPISEAIEWSNTSQIPNTRQNLKSCNVTTAIRPDQGNQFLKNAKHLSNELINDCL